MPRLIDLQRGWPSLSLFPSPQLLDGASEILQSQKKTDAALIYGPDAGYDPLRQSIADWLSSIYPGDAITYERVCISNGASANLGNVLAKFTEPGYTRNIWIIEPCYYLACPIFTDAGFEGRLRGVPEDDEGFDIDFLRSALREVETKTIHPQAPAIKTNASRYPKLYKHVIYAVPTFANPSGKTMSLHRREQLVRLAREFDALVVTDDVYDMLRWPSDDHCDTSGLPPAPPRIVDVDRVLDGGVHRGGFGNAVSNGSFSKIVAPGVRTGWAEAAPALALALSTVGSTRSGGCPSHMAAAFIDEMLVSGELQNHIRDRLVPIYRARHKVMMQTIEELLVPLGFKLSDGKPYEYPATNTNGTYGSVNIQTAVAVAGGYFTYLIIPSDVSISADELAAMALERCNLKFASGGAMTVEGDEGSKVRADGGYANGIRLCWAWETKEDISDGIQRLAKLVRDIKSAGARGSLQ